MRTLLLLSALAACCASSWTQITPTPAVPIRPEHIDPIRFRQFDANKDGKLDLQEQATERASRPAWEAEKRARVAAFRQEREQRQRQFDLEKFDANHDGQLDATEQKARAQYYEAVRGQFIKQYDKNGNGKIDAEEIRPPVPAQPAR